MLEYDLIDVSEEIDVNNTNDLKEYDICNYWYFLIKFLCMSCIFAMVAMFLCKEL